MTLPRIADARLRRQRITSTGFRGPADVVRWMGAVQAQEYGPAKWGLAQRMRGTPTDAGLDAAVGRGDILRTHVLRPTWHFVTPADVGWMLALTGPRVMRAMTAYKRQHGLEPLLVSKAMTSIVRMLEGRSLTRTEIGANLARRGLALKGTALALLMMHGELERLLCSGPYQGRHLTYALLDERLAASGVTPALGARPSRDEMVAELVRRFFQSHGPATTRDFAWWSGLTIADAKRGLEIVRGTSVDVDGLQYWTVGKAPAETRPARAHLLPIYDEYIVAYRDRLAVPHGSERLTPIAVGITFQHALIVDGQIAGTWKLNRRGTRVTPETIPLRALTGAEARDARDAARRCAQFFA
jgi:hypothetical protein